MSEKTARPAKRKAETDDDFYKMVTNLDLRGGHRVEIDRVIRVTKYSIVVRSSAGAYFLVPKHAIDLAELKQ